MKVRLLRDSQLWEGVTPAGLPIFRGVPRGYVHEHPEAYKLVQCGAGVPDDDECKAAAGLTDAQMAEAQQSWERANKGIAPEDYAAFDRGEMVGYDEAGKPIPGPNSAEVSE